MRCCDLMPSVKMYNIDGIFGAQSQVAGRAAVSRHASQTPTRESIICAERWARSISSSHSMHNISTWCRRTCDRVFARSECRGGIIGPLIGAGLKNSLFIFFCLLLNFLMFPIVFLLSLVNIPLSHRLSLWTSRAHLRYSSTSRTTFFHFFSCAIFSNLLIFCRTPSGLNTNRAVLNEKSIKLK